MTDQPDIDEEFPFDDGINFPANDNDEYLYPANDNDDWS